MTKERKYKEGDKVFIEAEVVNVDIHDNITPYRINYKSWVSKDEITELQQKPKIPQNVIVWYEENEAERADWNIFAWLDWKWMPSSIREWIVSDNRLQKEHALATLIAYGKEAVEVVKEPLYVVAIPDHSRDEFVQLCRNKKGELIIDREILILISDAHKLTESEIKAYDERLWVFAQPVEEVE